MKNFNIRYNVGTVKYLVSYHDGIKKHGDGSKFYDIATFRNIKKMNRFISNLKNDGYSF